MPARTDPPSIADRIRPVVAGAPVVATHFLGDTPVFVLGEEALLFATKDGEIRRPIHLGANLASVSDGERIVTGGDDGRIVATNAAGEKVVIATDSRRRWIDHVAAGPDGAVAWSAGKEARVRTAGGQERLFEAPSTVGGLAFAPKGFRLAVSHYNGVTLWFPNATGVKPEFLEWKGSHLAVTFSADARFLVTAMQEPTLHGWRLADGQHMRMAGYAAKVRAFAWTADGAWLASSGSTQLVLWPFHGKDGPMGRQPRLLAPAEQRVAAVACHPADDVAAVGYEHGLVLLVRIDDGAQIVAKKPGRAAISALAWNRSGTTLAFGCADGEAGVVPV